MARLLFPYEMGNVGHPFVCDFRILSKKRKIFYPFFSKNGLNYLSEYGILSVIG